MSQASATYLLHQERWQMRGQVVGGRGAKATDDYTQCISAVCVFTRKWHITYPYPYPYRVSCDLLSTISTYYINNIIIKT